MVTRTAGRTRHTARTRRAALVVSGLLIGAAASVASVSALPPPPSSVVATPPERFLDTRVGDPAAAGSLTSVAMAGEGDVPEGAFAVIISLAMVDAAGPGFASAVPTGSLAPGAFPTTSNVNYDAFAAPAIANTAIIPLPEVGTIDIYTSVETHLLVDVLGYIPAGAAYTPVELNRVLDTRQAGKQDPGTDYEVDVLGEDAPADANFVIVNLTMDQSAEWGFLTAWPTGSDFPPTSNVNVFGPGQTRAGLSILPIGEGGTISLRPSIDTDLIVDVFGYLGESDFAALDPFPRVYDSRQVGERVPALGTVVVEVAGQQNVPSGATAVFATVTATDASDPGFVTVWPTGLDQPEASNLNYSAGGTVANTVLVPVGADGTISLFTQSETDLIVDIIASF